MTSFVMGAEREIPLPERAIVHYLAMSRENGDGAGQLLFVHLFLDQAVQTFEALA